MRGRGAPVRSQVPARRAQRRVGDADVLKYERCPGEMRVIAALTSPEAIRAFLGEFGISTESLHITISPGLRQAAQIAAID